MSASVSAFRFRPAAPARVAELAPAASPRLARHRLFETRDQEALRRFLAEKNFSVEFPPDSRAPLEAHINGIHLAGMFLGHVSYGRAVTIAPRAERSDYWLQFSTHRRFAIDVGNERLWCHAQRGVVLSPRNENRLFLDEGCGRLVLSISRDAMVRQLAALLGRPVAEPLDFEPAIALHRGYGRTLERFIRAAVEEFEEHDALARSPMALSSLEQFIITTLLTSHPHNYSAELGAPAKRPASREVQRAIDYIEANLRAPITLADIVQAAGISGRVLFKHFKRATGISPMAYLREARFAGVREALLRARPDDRVVDIASLWGFDHIGRFAIEYRRRFGEKPSETKPRSRTA